MNKKKQEIDSKHLQQENLLNELFYLKKEISKCLQYKYSIYQINYLNNINNIISFFFRSSDSDIDLVPLDTFCVESPDSSDYIVCK